MDNITRARVNSIAAARRMANANRKTRKQNNNNLAANASIKARVNSIAAARKMANANRKTRNSNNGFSARVKSRAQSVMNARKRSLESQMNPMRNNNARDSADKAALQRRYNSVAVLRQAS